ncbi:5-formyltetrahydrofolate cyclo-ligase [Streptomyces sp. NPDC020792]|uniref:5-formyltetrahydrofolate cyclo-ligase n=1 Tax=Streptomyces sp. NPDC020792 TaxID=3365089 RepID=UPI003795D227
MAAPPTDAAPTSGVRRRPPRGWQDRVHGRPEAGRAQTLLPARPRRPGRPVPRGCHQPSRGSHRAHGRDALRPVDVVVLGSVAVNRDGARIGKGAGYSDLEFALLTEAGLIRRDTLVVTTVHTLQVIDDPIPVTDHDVKVDLIITPEEVIECTAPHRPQGILWDRLDAAKIAAIPALQTRANR